MRMLVTATNYAKTTPPHTAFSSDTAVQRNIRIATLPSVASVVHMIRPLRWLLLVCLIASAGGCANRQKSSARIYEGDSPSIKYTRERESAGGPVGGR
jgi:hypothetical protein